MDGDLPFSEPYASTSRAVLALPYKPELEVDYADDDFADAAALARYELAWSACSEKIESILSGLHDASLDQIVAFVRSAPDESLSLYATLNGRAPLRTGLIVAVLQPDMDETPAYTRKPCLVSRLTSRDCSNIKNALRSLIGGFIGSDIDLEAEEDGEDEEEVLTGGPSALKSQMLVPEDLLNLKAWYEHRFDKKEEDEAPTLVVLLEDLEAMDGKVLTQMIDALSEYVDSLPLVLLVGIATTADALFNLLSRKTAHKLDAARFLVDPGVSAFNALVRGLFVDWQAPLALAPKTYTDLWRTFEDLHHSIDATISFIQYLYMSHFATSPLSALTLLPNRDDPESLEADVLAALRDLPSVAASPTLSAPLLDPTAPSASQHASLASARAAQRAWHASRALSFEALLATLEFWGKKRSVESCLMLVLGEAGEGEVGKVVDELCGLVLQASSTKLPAFLRALSARLDSFLSTHPDLATSLPASDASLSPLNTFLTAQLAALEPILAAPRPPGKTALFNTNLALGGAGVLPGFGAGGGGGGAGAELDREFSKVARETSEGIKARLRPDSSLRHALRPCTELFLHELCFTSDSSAMKRFYPTPLPTLLRTLARLDPLSSLPDADASADEQETPHDLGIAYRVYRETHPLGRLVNLGEWFAGWELGAADEGEADGDAAGEEGNGRGKKRRRGGEGEDGENGEEDEEEEGDEDEEEDEDDEGPQRRKQARFLRAVGDLAHLGFIHPTTYRPEHVLKSVY
ncbi:hypothetical protein Rhopal_001636-T1 [Rhodotorula paludigena]|uniref:Origin recognition complex subunit 3 n=1 Tax=Rhodotorula paludigena TaxID=86838 RepID=A0AAV5G846_9BASI|nr:hypothetical protein Rhopal_001636-T1 [Rhodotorula paludigena]